VEQQHVMKRGLDHTGALVNDDNGSIRRRFHIQSKSSLVAAADTGRQ
jgi:hypothetical protein